MANNIVGEAEIDVRASQDRLRGDLRGAERTARNSASKINSSILSIAKGAAGFLGLGVAISKVSGFLRESVKLFGVQEVAENRLRTAVGKNVDALIEYAGQLQKVTTFGDEQIIEAQALIGSFIKEEDQIKSLTSATLDFASAKNIDLRTAADLLTKTVASETNALSRYGLTVEGAAGSTERITSAVNAISSAFGGQAEASLNTFEGRVTSLLNRFGDLQERIGSGLIPIINKLVSVGNGLLDFLEPTTSAVRDEAIEVNSLVAELTSAETTQAERLRIYKELQRVNSDVVKGVDAENISVEKLRKNVSQYNKELVQRLVLERRENKVAEERSNRADLLENQLNLESKAYSSIADAVVEITKQIEQGGSAFKTSEQLIAVREELNNILASGLTTIEKTSQAFDVLHGTQLPIVSTLASINSELNKNASASIESEQRLTDLTNKLNQTRSQFRNAPPLPVIEIEEPEDIILGDQYIEDKRVALEQLLRTIDDIAARGGQVTQTQFFQAQEGDLQGVTPTPQPEAVQESESALRNLIPLYEELGDLGQYASDSISGGFARGIVQAQTFSDILKNIGNQLLTIGASSLFRVAIGSFGGGGLFGAIGSLFSPGDSTPAINPATTLGLAGAIGGEANINNNVPQMGDLIGAINAMNTNLSNRVDRLTVVSSQSKVVVDGQGFTENIIQPNINSLVNQGVDVSELR